MTRDYLDIDRHWGILAYYDVIPADFSQLGPILREFSCPEEEIEKAWQTIHYSNKAFIFNVPWARMSVLVVGHVTHPSQFLNSLLHEFDHLQDAILQYYDVPLPPGLPRSGGLRRHPAAPLPRLPLISVPFFAILSQKNYAHLQRIYPRRSDGHHRHPRH